MSNRQSRERVQTTPLVSILIAVRNDAGHLRRCLDALVAQDYLSDRFEVILADGRSTDATPEIIRSLACSAPFRVVAVDNASGGAAAGFNAALRAAHGDLVVILGARAQAAPDFISAGVQTLHETGADAVGGTIAGKACGLQSEAVALALASPFGVGDAHYRYASNPGEVDTINYGMYRRELFDEVGCFDETMENVEDDEFNYRLREAGKRLFLSPAIRCRYNVRPSVLSLAGQYGRYGYPKIRVLLKHPRQMRPRQFAPAGLVGGLGLALLLSSRLAPARWVFGGLLAAYTAVSAVASLRIARSSGWRYLPLLPIAFAGMHFAYGAASLVGAIRFGVPWIVFRQNRPSPNRGGAR
jgi:GT2 family glycosyltransferase